MSLESDRSSSFSLQECMNEFRARRFRRSSKQYRQDANSTGNGKNIREKTDIDLVYQNLCNKEQERKFKPCRNGFCYCFTSDSGDGLAAKEASQLLGNLRMKSSRRRNRFEKTQFFNANKQVTKCAQYNKKSSRIDNQSTYSKNKNNLIAICSVEESSVKEPLIHIIQELHQNCIISKVKLNKSKLLSVEKVVCPNKKSTTLQKAADKNKGKNHSSAPSLDYVFELDGKTKKANSKKRNSLEMQCNFGGKLLQKRQSSVQLNYQPKYIYEAHAKPPRTSVSANDTLSIFDSTSSSVYKTERFKENILESKNCNFKEHKTTNNHAINSIKRAENGKEVRDEKYPSRASIEVETEIQNTVPKYPSLDDAKKNENNIRPSKDDAIKVIDFGCNETKIKDMLNTVADSNPDIFDTTYCKGQPQHIPSKSVLKNEKLPEMQIPAKVSLDTVDGVVHQNLASNCLKKITPGKKKIISPKENLKKTSVKEKSFWSEQLRNLSPWSKKIYENNNNKNNFCFQSKAFLTSSKTKLLHLISPKKERRNSTRLCFPHSVPNNDDFQTKANTIHQQNSISPPESYISAMHSSHVRNNTECSLLKNLKNTTINKPAEFDFTRTVQSPTRKIFRTSHRKLHFPLNCSDRTFQSISTFSPLKCSKKETYRSFSSELDQDVLLSKINFLLGHIRTKLEANDQQAVRMFQEACDITDRISTGFDCPDSHYQEHTGESISLNKYAKVSKDYEYNLNEPIYTEIEGDKQYLSKDSDFCNRTKIQRYGTSDDPNILYTKIDKLDKKRAHCQHQIQPISLGQIIMESVKSEKAIGDFSPLESLAKQSTGKANPNCLSLSSNSLLSHSLSLNNVRSLQNNSSPNQQSTLSKSEFSLQRSTLFLENLLKSELFVDSDFETKTAEKEKNEKSIICYSNTGMDAEYCSLQTNLSSSLSMDEELKYESCEKPTIKNDLTKRGFSSLKKVLRKSFRKSKMLICEKTKCLSTPNNFPTYGPSVPLANDLYRTFNFDLNTLFSFNESENFGAQIAQAVSICRQLPDLESSMEMVEAERLLLFSSLNRKSYQRLVPVVGKTNSMSQRAIINLLVDEMYLPVLVNADHEKFFNIFYIVTFECCGVIKSSHTGKCENGVAAFEDKIIEVINEIDAYNQQKMNQDVVKCNVFMLRLRKFPDPSSVESTKTEIIEPLEQSPSTTPSSTSSDTSGGIVSRFRLQASFNLYAKDFTPYEYIHQEPTNRDRICIRASNLLSLPLIPLTKSSNLTGEIRLKGRAEILAPKLIFHGFLNVLDPFKQHDWNKRYCTLDGIFLYVWKDKSNFNITPLISIDLRNSKHNNYPLTSSPRELCARPRSFYLNLELNKTFEYGSSSAVFFSADSQANLDSWLTNLNIAMDFILTWL